MNKDLNRITFFHLLRVAVGTTESEAIVADGVDWKAIYALARKQGVTAITFDGLTKLFEQDTELSKSFPRALKLQWINSILNIEKRYEHSTKVSADLADKWSESGIKTVCLKGMAFSTYYPVPSHRECGDFDCYLYDNYAKGNAIARELGAKVDEEFYKHSEIIYRKLMVENHQYIVATRASKTVRAFNAMLDAMLREESSLSPLFDTKILMPSPMFNALFMTYHSHGHFLSEGIRLRHILDWAMFLEKEQNALDWEKFYAICEEQGLRTFADVQTAIAVKVFGIKIENKAVVVESPYTERVLTSIMEDDTAIYSQNIGKWHMRMLVLRNLFASSWKYKAFSDRGVISKFFSLIRGFVFRTEE